MGQGTQSRPSKICGRHPLKNLLGPLLNTLTQISLSKGYKTVINSFYAIGLFLYPPLKAGFTGSI